MLTEQDIQKLLDAQKEVFATKAEFSEFTDSMRADFSSLQTVVDSYAKKADTYFQEMSAMRNRMDRLEKGLAQLAEKAGVKLEEF